MMPTLFDALLKTQELLKELHQGTATGGSTTTLVDTTLDAPTAIFNGGTLFVLTGDNAGKCLSVVYDGTTKTFTFAEQTEPVAEGDLYAVASPHYTRTDLLQAIRQALEDIGTFTQIDDTLTADEDLEEYDLPDGVLHVVRVQVAANATEPHGWKTVRNWRQVGTKLIFDAPLTADGMPMRVYHNARHPALEDDTDSIDPMLNLMRLAWTAAYYAAFLRSRNVQNQEPHTAELVKLADEKRFEMQARYPVMKLLRDVRFSQW
jgi:hypothetical protein